MKKFLSYYNIGKIEESLKHYEIAKKLTLEIEQEKKKNQEQQSKTSTENHLQDLLSNLTISTFINSNTNETISPLEKIKTWISSNFISNQPKIFSGY